MSTQGMIPAKENANKKISDRYQKKTYAKGATCIYGDTLYRAKADITTAEEWNAAHWEETNMETIRAGMAADLSSLNAKIAKTVHVTGNAVTINSPNLGYSYDAIIQLPSKDMIPISAFATNGNVGTAISFHIINVSGLFFVLAKNNYNQAVTIDANTSITVIWVKV